MILVMALLDMFGIASIMPFIAIMSNPDLVDSNEYLNFIYHYIGMESKQEFLFYSGVVLLIALVTSILFKAATTYALLKFTHLKNYSMSKRLVEGYLQQSYEWFLHRHSADLGKSILTEVEKVVGGALLSFIQLVAQGAVVLAVLVLLLIVDPLITAIVFVTLGILYTLIYSLLRKYLKTIGEQRIIANKDRYQIVQEMFGGIKDVKSTLIERVMLNKFDGPAKAFAQTQASAQVINHMPRFVLEALVFGTVIVIMLNMIATPQAIEQALPVIAVYAFAGYRLLPALQQVFNHMASLRFSHSALVMLSKDMQRIYQIATDNFHEDSGKIRFEKRIELRGVGYTYPLSEQKTLRDINLVFEKNSITGVVGKTGSGKSTLIDIVMGLLSPGEGGIYIDNQPLKPNASRKWRRNIGYVPQQIFLLDDSIAANIAFGVPETAIDKDRIVEVAKIANIHDFIMNEAEKGYQTLVGERGVRLSGGQRQRIGIARALYHDPEILIFDEATSALDNVTEQELITSLNNLQNKKTIIMIAHRLSSVKICSHIIFIEKGTILDAGSYKDLSSRNRGFFDAALQY
ncbi:MAG: ABC transporter ATP-binding protein [Gammaproteobacteria bacterium]|nr:ABC transporter ATP-binding protein [Gammaproteobacteria bacterium]